MRAVIGDRPEHYERLGIAPGIVQPWEDGIRTGAAEGTWEWWYCDAHLEDGSTLTVEFHTKPPYASPSVPLTPFVLLTLSLPDGTRIDRAVTEDAEAFDASTETCDVRIGANTFRGNPDEGYAVHVEIEDIAADITLTPEIPAWRPATGHVFFGEQEEHYIAWLPVAARAAACVTLVREGRTEQLEGMGYHDHNWGNVAPRRVLDHWYWGRACIGDYTVVTLNFVADETYGKATVPACMIAKSGQILASAVGPQNVTCAEMDVAADAGSGVPVARRLEYRTGDAGNRYKVTFEHRRNAFMLDFGRAGAYHRFLGDVSIEHVQDGHIKAEQGQTLWELLYFGPRPEGHIAGMPDTKADTIPVIGHQA
nr:hydroxyneurosporene dehydrogenase [Streptomyces chartreusis]